MLEHVVWPGPWNEPKEMVNREAERGRRGRHSREGVGAKGPVAQLAEVTTGIYRQRIAPNSKTWRTPALHPPALGSVFAASPFVLVEFRHQALFGCNEDEQAIGRQSSDDAAPASCSSFSSRKRKRQDNLESRQLHLIYSVRMSFCRHEEKGQPTGSRNILSLVRRCSLSYLAMSLARGTVPQALGVSSEYKRSSSLTLSSMVPLLSAFW